MSELQIPLGPKMPAVRNTVSLLRKLASSTRPLGAASLSRSLGMPRSSTYQLLQVLIDEGLVVHIPELRAYSLGLGVFELGSAYLRHEPLEFLARPILAKLAAAARETAQLGILHGHESLYLLKQQPALPVPLVTDVGVRLPAHLTASGRAVLALLPVNQVAAIFDKPANFVDRTGVGPANLAQLNALLETERKHKWVIEEGSVTDGVVCIASAATDHAGRPVASVVVSFLGLTQPRERIPEISQLVVKAADALTRRLGGQPRP